MKKYISLFLVALLLLQFAACSGKGKKETDKSDFAFSQYEDGVTIDKYLGKASDVVIPSKIDGTKVLAISSNAFKKSDVLTSVEIPDTVKEIGEYAFYYCEKLTKVIIGSGVETIGKSAFDSSYSITSLTINGNSLKKISDKAFANVEDVEHIKFPESVEYVGSGAFDYDELLTISVKEGSYLHNYAKEHDIPYITY